MLFSRERPPILSSRTLKDLCVSSSAEVSVVLSDAVSSLAVVNDILLMISSRSDEYLSLSCKDTFINSASKFLCLAYNFRCCGRQFS